MNDGRGAESIVGADRDAAHTADALVSGTSVVVVGALGSGKSHFLREVTARLRAAGVDPLVLRTGGPLANVPLGALDSARDARADALRAGTTDGTLLVVIDDAHELDDASAASVVHAVYAGQITALLGVPTRDESPGPAGRGGSTAAQMTVDLWLRGLAERVDLGGLTIADADDLLVRFGGGQFDALTRARVIALADGSRMLLRELAREAAAALRGGRDPLSAVRHPPRNGRLSDAVAAHVARFDHRERVALALLGRVPHLPFDDAARLMPVEVLDALIHSGRVYDDGSEARRLTANGVLAAESDRAERPAVDAVFADIAREMLDPAAHWWSPPIAQRIAHGWLRGETILPARDEVAAAARIRAARDAARAANDAGDHDLVLSFAREAPDDVVLRVESQFARAGAGALVDGGALRAAISTHDADASELLRWARMTSALAGADEGLDELGAWLRDTAAARTPAAAAEMQFVRASAGALTLDWETVISEAAELMTRTGASASLRLRAAVLVGWSYATLGDVAQARAWFLRARRLVAERDGATPIGTVERLWALSCQVLADAATGEDATHLLPLLEVEYAAAAREDDPETIAMVGWVATGVAATLGDIDRAEIELRAALRRTRAPLQRIALVHAEYIVARAFALHGRPRDARAVLDLADPRIDDRLPALRHARLSAEAWVLAAEGRGSDAVARARAATAVAESAPVLLIHDLFQLAALGEEPESVLPRMHEIVEITTAPVARLLTERATRLVDERAGSGDLEPTEMLRLASVWGGGNEVRRRPALTLVSGTGALVRMPAPRDAGLELTRREREIALLVAEGLSNREIATRLFLSVRTIESHIYQARAKVDARSRGDLGRIVADSPRSLS